MRMEHHWRYLYRGSHFRGTTITDVLSAIGIACGHGTVEDGFILLAAGPGIASELADDAVERYQHRARRIQARPHVGGAVVDR
jgi:hypothetical protein